MKKNTFSIVAFLLFVLALPAISFAQKNKNIHTTVIKTKIYCDHCKQCETCGDKFNKDLYNEDGIKSVEVDAKANTITVVYDTRKIDLNKIKVLISKLGYDADEIKADPAGVAKLDGCCKK
jgi:mercuric ion binding protein